MRLLRWAPAGLLVSGCVVTTPEPLTAELVPTLAEEERPSLCVASVDHVARDSPEDSEQAEVSGQGNIS
jgi:hypothetical protein